MEKRDIVLVLEQIKEKPGIHIKKIHEYISDKISWADCLLVFTESSKKGLIIREDNCSTITPLGINKLEELRKELLIDSDIKELTIKELQGNVFQLKYWWLIILLNAIISILISLAIR